MVDDEHGYEQKIKQNLLADKYRQLANLLLLLAVRTALVALIAFMPTSPNGALGSLDYKKEERRALAVKSREASPKFGMPERQKLIDEVCYFAKFYCFSSNNRSWANVLMLVHQNTRSTST